MRFISINAQPVATTYMPDMRALQMLGHLPVLLHPDPKEVLIIGLGAGVSSGHHRHLPRGEARDGGGTE